MKIIYEQDDHDHVAVMAVKGGVTIETAANLVPKGKRFKLVADDSSIETNDFAAANDGTGTRE